METENESKKKKSWFVSKDELGYRRINTGRIILTIILFLFVLITILNCFTVVPSGHTGVRSVWGIVDQNNTVTGFSWKIPYVQTVEQVNNKVQDITTEGQIWSETSARTAVYYEGITISYQILPEASAWICANVNDYKNTLVNMSAVSSAIKMSSKTLSDEDATSRAIVEPLIAQNLQSVLTEKFGREVVAITRVAVSNADFDSSYNNAIAEKQKASIEYEQLKIENQKSIEAAEAAATVKKTEAEAQAAADKIEAEAKAEVKKINAKAEAEALKIEADAEAEANKKLSESITDNILKQDYYEKWDGKLPSVIAGGSDSVTMMIPTTGE